MSNRNDNAIPARYRSFLAPCATEEPACFRFASPFPTRYPPAVTWALIAASCAVFFIQLNLSPAELQESVMERAEKTLPTAQMVHDLGYGVREQRRSPKRGRLVRFLFLRYSSGDMPGTTLPRQLRSQR
jgi:hypothetical protein